MRKYSAMASSSSMTSTLPADCGVAEGAGVEGVPCPVAGGGAIACELASFARQDSPGMRKKSPSGNLHSSIADRLPLVTILCNPRGLEVVGTPEPPFDRPTRPTPRAGATRPNGTLACRGHFACSLQDCVRAVGLRSPGTPSSRAVHGVEMDVCYKVRPV
jgi:hypothetical protein